MKKYLIIFLSKNPQSVIDRIKSFEDWVHVKDSVWGILTKMNTVDEVRDQFNDLIKGRELLMVLEISQPHWAGIKLPVDVAYWLT